MRLMTRMGHRNSRCTPWPPVAPLRSDRDIRLQPAHRRSVRIPGASPMWIVRVALQRPYTFVVLALLILGIGPLTIARTPTDIFPNIDIPVVTAIWNYGGLSAQEMTDRIISNYERSLSTAVNHIAH